MARVPSVLLAILFVILAAGAAGAADDEAIDRGANSKAFPLLASTYAVINALDIYTTMAVVKSGAGVEANPVMASVAGNPVALTAVKAASTAATIVIARRLWRRHPAAAIVLLVGANAGMTFVVAHNARVLNSANR